MIDTGAVKRGFEHGEMFLEYLPLMELQDNRCVGAEALIRWRRGTAVTFPDDFIPAIENTPLSGLITYWVIETVAHELGTWLRQHENVFLSINVPPEILGRGGMEYAAAKAGLQDLRPKLILEVTERGIPDKLGVDGLNAAAKHGMRVALDDVGIRGVDFAILCRVHVDMIKIDKSFVNELGPDDGKSPATFATIMNTTSLDIVVEGVETATQADTLRRAGFRYAQGFYFSRPIAAKEFEAFYRARQ